MKAMTRTQIENAISNVNATLAVEGLQPSPNAMEVGKRFLKNEISIETAIKLTTDKILSEKARLEKA